MAWLACKVCHSNERTRKNTFYCPAGRASRHVLAKATLMSCVCVPVGGADGQLIYMVVEGNEGRATCSLIRSVKTKVQSMWKDA